MALGVAGLGCEDALTHLLNYVWPNIFETSPHVVNAVMGAVDGCRLAIGPAIILNYLMQVGGPFHGRSAAPANAPWIRWPDMYCLHDCVAMPCLAYVCCLEDVVL
jgi:hypothetical protein